MNPTETKPIVPQRVAEINAEIARQGNQGFSVAPSAPTYTPPSTITTSSMAPVKPMNLATPTPLTGADGLLGSVQSGATNFQTDLQQKTAQQQKVDEPQAKTDTSKKTFMQKYFGTSGEIAKTDKEYSKTVDPIETELNTINQEIFDEEQALLKQLESLQKEGTLTDVQKNARSNELKRQSASYQADLYVKQLGIQGRYDSAKRIADRKIAVELEQEKRDLEILKFDYEENKELFTKEEQRQFEQAQSDRERALNAKEAKMKQFEDTRLSLLKSANEQQAPIEVKNAILNAKTVEEAVGAAGQYGTDVLERQIKREQLNNARMQGQKLAQEIEQGKPLTGEFAGIINSAAGLVPNTKKSTVKANIANAIASENYTTAYAEIANAVSDGLTGTNKTTFDDARTDIGVMVGMRKAIKDYTDAGGDVGFLKGTADQIAKKFGQLAVDPKFAALGTQLTREFQAYRNAMTGAAFTPEESREYAAVNPRTNANLDLNLATIDGALNQLTNRVTSTVNARIPDAQKIYDLAFTKSGEMESQTPVGDIQYVGGVKYTKAQDGLYYPENKTQTPNTQTTTPSISPSYQSLNSNQFSGLGSFFKFK